MSNNNISFLFEIVTPSLSIYGLMILCEVCFRNVIRNVFCFCLLGKGGDLSQQFWR